MIPRFQSRTLPIPVYITQLICRFLDPLFARPQQSPFSQSSCGTAMLGDHIAPWRTEAQGHLSPDANNDLKTDYSRWRLLDDDGRQTWHYLESDEENKKWPQSIADKYFLGLPTVYTLVLLTYQILIPTRDFRNCPKQSLLCSAQKMA